jgi:hypothetical protein
MAAEELVECSRAETRRLLSAANEAFEQARAHASRAAAGGWRLMNYLQEEGAGEAEAELKAAAAARDNEAAVRNELAEEEKRLQALVADTDAAWVAEGHAREEADRTVLVAAQCEAAYRRERSVCSARIFTNHFSHPDLVLQGGG